MRSIPTAVRTMSKDARVLVQPPVFRRLRVLAMDPGIAARFESSVANEVTLPVPWEALQRGPVGEYVAVVDEDERGEPLNEGVDLDAPELLAQDGLAPSAGDPQFRQQMAYAVAMRTIRSFERALGRSIHWHQPDGAPYVKHLRIEPHGLADANAHFSPEANVARFGLLRPHRDGTPAGGSVFLSGSPDVLTHTVTHAILLGLGFSPEDAGPDVRAFQEGFADLVVALQRFFPSDPLGEQLAAIRGDLGQSRTLGAIGLEFGQALQEVAGIRNALGSVAADGAWLPRLPDPAIYARAEEPHERGSALFYAVFDAFHQLYDWRVADLRRIASKGTGELPKGELHPDLVARFMHEACKVARQLLDVCVAALDYLPPVGFTFGDYLRALVTADLDASAADDRRHRAALLGAFRSYGILPADVAAPAVETLRWPRPAEEGAVAAVAREVRSLSTERAYWSLPRDRAALWKQLDETGRELRARLATGKGPAAMLGPVDLSRPFEVRVSPMERTRVSGQMSLWWAVKVIQRREAKGRTPGGATGTTLIVDAASGTVRYRIDAPSRARGRPRRARAPDPFAAARGTPQRVPPLERRLRVFAFDPSMGLRLETARINEVTLRVPWERTAQGAGVVGPGPVGEYVEVVDRDPASGCFYDPVDLDQPELIATSGLAPSESNPQFHQQMVYAVAMRTIRTFETALGRLALWAPRHRDEEGRYLDEYVQRLRIYPHALREANAYYSPDKLALLFGYFPAPVEVQPGAPRPTVFTCLSQDVVAHEVTHALLDGMHRRFSEASNPDVRAFHEAFADLVALFQHFSLPDVLRHQIAATRGDLASQNRLGELAQQFGQAIGNRGALRSAIGTVDEAGAWHPLEANPDAYATTLEPHDRGAILVAAVFDAFLTIYKARIAGLLRIATEGTGVLPEGQVHPDVVNRLADEAARTARNVLAMCIRALDYCPPVDLTFGDYLRALVTADFDYDPEDAEHRRVAFVEAFRRRGIIPEDVRTLSADGLLWRPTSAAPDEDAEVVLGIVRSWATDLRSWDLSRDRRVLHELMAERRAALHAYLEPKLESRSAILSAIDPSMPFEVHSVRPSIRSDFEGAGRFQWVLELTQRVPQFLDPDAARRQGARPDYDFRGGCTLLVDAESGRVRYSIKKPLDERRRERQRRYLVDEGCRNLAATYFGGVAGDDQEPFAALHRL